MKKLIMLVAVAVFQTSGAYAAAPTPKDGCEEIYHDSVPIKGVPCDVRLVLCETTLKNGDIGQIVYTDITLCADGSEYHRTDTGIVKKR